MPRRRVDRFTISIDGYGSGPRQDVENLLGVGGLSLHQWMVDTRTFNQMYGGKDGTTGIDDDLVSPA